MPYLEGNEAVIDIQGRRILVDEKWHNLVRVNGAVDRIQVRMVDPVLEEALRKCDVNEIDKSELRKVLTKFEDLWKGDEIGRTTVIEHRCDPSIRCSIAVADCVPHPQVYGSAKGGYREGGSGYDPEGSGLTKLQSVRVGGCASEEEDWRVAVLCGLAAVERGDSTGRVPRIDDLLRAVRGSRWFIAMDLRVGYWQVAMRAEDIPKTEFRTPSGLYEFVVMPFGLVNAPATFQRMVESLFGDLYWNGVLVYLDDILIHAATLEEVFVKLEEVLKRLRASGLKLRFVLTGTG
ncbi:RNA-directed DNA polymerase [Gregarina niphandrodes]|uniref:RNA-directed DNA polymerase n=1 Tax=Gregarina niphandrodes TaxID=110365 RepID=A0A023B8D6_GRENI|nr:RNA-directed DNA polymerase [Gregarina niphandrodes]EZG68848.1 RNA-directed DNA polymerase [Gregarina niphandrodes]|eukprot:XP_011134542.1 RNA-directed DNA polymerase [Gregarina niphandrodes]